MTIKYRLKYGISALLLSLLSTLSFAQLPGNYIACAMDYQTCTIKAGTNPVVYYGAADQFVSANKNANFTCTTASFSGQDPISGTAKSCYIPIDAAVGPGGTGASNVSELSNDFSRCGSENAQCTATGIWSGYYGAPGAYTPIAGSGNFTCALANFHIPDPVNGASKACYLQTSDAPVIPSGSNTLVPSVPAGYKPCAVDGGVCRVTGVWNGYYGAQGKFAPIQGDGEFICLPATFGINDPYFGITKTCYVNNAANTPPAPGSATSVPKGFIACAVDGQVCNAQGDWTLYYGVNSSYVTVTGSGAFTCLPGDLGVSDPAFGTQKTCYVSQSARTVSSMPQSGYTKCAVDFAQCNRTGAWEGYYGADTTFVEIKGNGSFKCQPDTFNINDPLNGTPKACYVKNPPPAPAANCSWQSQSGNQFNSYAASQAQCSCKCAANTAKSNSCTFNSSRINNFVCLPGQLP